MKPATLANVLVLSILGLACSKKNGPPAKSWYDAAPLVVSLRTDERAGAARAAGVASLTELPLYDLSLELERGLQQFRLRQDLYFTNTLGAPLDELVLRIYANAVGDNPPVRFVSGACSDAPCSVASPSASVISIKPSAPLAPGERLLVRLELQGKLPHIDPARTSMLAQGLESLSRMGSKQGAGDYGLLAESDGVASLANFYPVIARRDNGSWVRSEGSTLGDLGAGGLSHVRVSVVAPADVRVVSSGITTGTKPIESDDAGARHEVDIVAALVRDFALLASHRFETASQKVGEIEVRSHYVADDAKSGRRVLDAAARSLAVFERRFGRYPYADLDVVEAPLVGGAGGVEFSGLVTVASMLYRPMLADGPLGMLSGLLGGAQAKQVDEITDSMLEFVTAHEVAHQYWPGLVGSDSRTHPWADEALAQYSALVYFEDRHGAKRAELEGERQVLANYQMMRLLGKPDGKVDRAADAFDSEIAYAGLVYGKAPFFFRELRKTVGDDAFFAALRAHVAEHRMKTAPPRALIDRLSKGEKGDAVKKLARRWLDEAHGDADLGAPDLRQILAGFLGKEAVENMGPELEMATRLLMKLLGPGAAEGGGGGLLDLLGGGAKDPDDPR
jgi:hypothetical protein